MAEEPIIPLEDLIECAEREVKMREFVFNNPRGRVAKGQMTQQKADTEIRLMKGIVANLKAQQRTLL